MQEGCVDVYTAITADALTVPAVGAACSTATLHR